METIKKGVTKITNNPIGAIAGAVVAYWAVKKYAGVTKTWQLAGLAIVGVVVGASVQNIVRAKMSAPTATLTAKK